MCDETRILLDELIERYELEPTLRDVFVEGSSDRNRFSWFLHEVGIDNVLVRDINTIDIRLSDPSDCSIIGGGNRQRVIALAQHIETNIPGVNQITCIIDSDFDIVMGRNNYVGPILNSDYANMEMYLLNERVLTKFLRVVLATERIDVIELIQSIIPPLRDLFLIRLTNAEMDLHLSWIDPTPFCDFSSSSVSFRMDDYINDYLRRNSYSDNKASFINTINQLHDRLDTEPRNYIHGHDFVHMLRLALDERGLLRRTSILPGSHRGRKTKKVHIFNDDDTFAHALCGCIEVSHLDEEPLFQNLVERIRS